MANPRLLSALSSEPVAEYLQFRIEELSAQRQVPAQNLTLVIRPVERLDAVLFELSEKVATFDGGTLEYRELVDGDIDRLPADWWQALKERFAPRWCLRRWPVRYRETRLVTQQARGYLPRLPLNSRDERYAVVAAWREPRGK